MIGLWASRRLFVLNCNLDRLLHEMEYVRYNPSEQSGRVSKSGPLHLVPDRPTWEEPV